MSSDNRPSLRQGQLLPVGLLDPKAFERFLLSLLSALGDQLGLTHVRGLSEGTDDGFDGAANRVGDGGNVCLQGKRLSKALSVRQVAAELAKVALVSATEDSKIVAHYIITSGTIAKTLKAALRENGRTQLYASVNLASSTSKELAVRREAVKARKLDPASVVTKYLDGLDLHVLTISDLEIYITRNWSRLTDLISRFFVLEHVLREHPRPELDEQVYLNQLLAIPPDFVRLEATSAGVPGNNIVNKDVSDPLAVKRAQNHEVLNSNATSGVSESDASAIARLVSVEPGAGLLLVAGGGAGKTTTLKMACAQAAKYRQQDTDFPLPILIDLSLFDGSLSELIAATLSAKGDWKSLPGTFMLFADGLNEAPTETLRQIGAQLSDPTLLRRTAIVVASRTGALRMPIHLSWADKQIGLEVIGLRDVARMAGLLGHKMPAFLKEFRHRVRDLRLTRLPFGAACAIAIYEDTGKLPPSDRELIGELLARRLIRNRDVPGLSRLAQLVPEEALLTLAQLFAFEMRIIRDRITVPHAVGLEIIQQNLKRIRLLKHIAIPDALDDATVFELLVHHEFIKIISPKFISIGHEIVADFLASTPLAAEWMPYLPGLDRQGTARDAWWFAASNVQDKSRYLAEISKLDLILAARCARSLGIEACAAVESEVLGRLKIGASQEQPGRQEFLLALGILATPTSIAYLRASMGAIVQRTDLSRHGIHLKALTWAGDEDTLKYLLLEGDKLSSNAFTVSGGEIELWESAPVPKALDLARARLSHATSIDPVVLSAKTVARLGDEEDVVLLERVVMGHSDLVTVIRVFWAMYSRDRERAVKALKTRKGAVVGNEIQLWKTLVDAGVSIDLSPLVDALLLTPSVANVASSHIKSSAAEILRTMKLDGAAISRLRAALGESETTLIWSIAAAHQLVEFCDVAIARFATASMNEAGTILAFAAADPWVTPSASAQFHSIVLERFTAGRLSGDTWTTAHLVRYLQESGDSTRGREILFKELSDLGTKALSSEIDDLASFETQMDLQDLLPLAGPFQGEIPNSSLLGLMHVDVSTMPEEMRHRFALLLRAVPGRDIDEEILKLPDDFPRLNMLCLILSIGSSEIRETLLKASIPLALKMPSVANIVAPALRAVWNTELSKSVLAYIAAIQWDSGAHQMAFDVLDVVGKCIGEDAVFQIDELFQSELPEETRALLRELRNIAMRTKNRS
jgi:hypothetical protein